MTEQSEWTTDDQFVGKEPAVRATYDALLQALKTLGPLTAEAKKTSIHLVRKTGFAGIHTRKSHFILNIRTDYPIESPRITKMEQVSKSRFHNELKLQTPEDINAELLGWLADAYRLSA